MTTQLDQDTHPYLTLSKGQIRSRLQASVIRQGLLHRLPTIQAEKMEFRLRGLLRYHPSFATLANAWLKELTVARLQQAGPEIEAIEANYSELLRSKNLEEFWYKESEEGSSIVMSHYGGLSDALKQTEDCS